MCILAKTKICHFVHFFIFIILLLFFYRHNSLQKQNLGIKVARLVKWISAHVHELLLTSFSNSNSPSRVVQIPFDAAKLSVNQY